MSLSIERKGRGGKTVTVVRGLTLRGGQLDAFVKRLKRHLGTGGSIEDGAIVVGGDQRDRLEPWLRAQGVARVSVG